MMEFYKSVLGGKLDLSTFKEGGNIVEPLKKAPWGDTFAMFTDKYGMFWLVNIAGKKD